MALKRSGFRFCPLNSALQVGLSFAVSVIVSLRNLTTLTPEIDANLRVGVGNLAVTVSSSNPTVLAPQAGALSFIEGSRQQLLTVQPVASGSATLTIQQPPGFTPATSSTLPLVVP